MSIEENQVSKAFGVKQSLLKGWWNQGVRAAVTQLQIRKDMSWPKTDVKVCMKKTFSKKTALCSRETKKNHKDKSRCSLEKTYLAEQERMVSNRSFVGVEATSVCYKFSRLI